MTSIIAIILVNWNGQADTLECLASLQEEIYPNKQIIIVDNGSADNSPAAIRAAYPDVTVIETGANLGFTGGNNVGIAYALEHGADFLFLLNNDTTLESDTLGKLLRCAETHPGAAAITPAIYHHAEPSRPWFMGSKIDWRNCTLTHQLEDVRAQNALEPFAIPWANGCAMFMPADKMRQIGSLDERYFCYCEDVDWSLRAQRRGYTCLLCPEAVVYHKVSASAGFNSPKQNYYMHRNNCLIIVKHTHGLKRIKTLALRTRRGLRMIVRYIKHRSESDNTQQARSLFFAMLDFYCNRFGRCRHI